jgi:glucose 1-dehydrogenase
VRAVVVRPPSAGAALEDVAAPPLLPGTVRVGVLECGVCGTDRDIVAGKYGRAPPGAPSLILGHENLGIVRETAPGVGGFVVGDLVVATVRRGCGRCRFCRTNHSDFCETGAFTERGIAGTDGYMAEEYVDAPEYLVRVPTSLKPHAVLLEPLSVVEKAVSMGQLVLDRKEPTPGDPRTTTPTALVAGTGAVGMLAAFLLRVRGYDVTSIDRQDGTDAAAGLLARIGAVHRSVANGLDSLGSITFDLVLEATGSAQLDFGLVGAMGPNGVLVLTGLPDASQAPTPVAGGALWRNVVLDNQAVVGSVNANRDYFEAGIRDLVKFEQRWPGAVAALITSRRPMEEFAEAIAPPPPGSMKTVLTVRSGGALAPSP